MDTEAHWLADRTLLRSLVRTQPAWTYRDFADATHRSRGWVKKWLARLRAAAPDDEHVLHSQSRARKQPPPAFDPRVIDRILEIRDQPPGHLRRIPGPKAILYYLARDTDLQAANLRLPRSTRTVWQILRAHGRIPIPGERTHTLVERPAPMSVWQLDYKDVSSVPTDPDGKRQHVVEVLNSVDVGTSLLVSAQVRADFTAETTLEALVATFRRTGVPTSITLDRDPRFVGAPLARDFPGPVLRLLHCLGVQVTICPPRRPDKNAFVERLNRTFEYECLRVERPSDEATACRVTAAFQAHYNHERPNQAVSCRNQPPAVAFPDLPPLPPLPADVDPDRWLDVLDGQRYVRKVQPNGSVQLHTSTYYIEQARRGQYVSLRIDAPQRCLVVEYGEQVLKTLPIRGLVGERMALEDYVAHLCAEARSAMLVGRPVGRQLRLL
jgi:Integrase core domain